MYTQDISRRGPLSNYNKYTPRNTTNKEKAFHQICEKEVKQRAKTGDIIIVLNDMSSEDDITAVVSDLLAKKKIAVKSSIFVLVPTSDYDD